MLRIASTPALFIVALATLACPHAHAQGVLRAQISGSQTGRFIQAPRSLQQQIREAERSIEEESYSDAVVRLGDLLSGDSEALAAEDLAGQDFLLDIREPSGRDAEALMNQSLLRSARDRIGSLPSAALETYRLRYEPLARRLLDEAAEVRDWYQVQEVRRRYFHTHAGYEASALLAQHQLYRGHPLAASLLLDDIVTHASAVEHLGPGIVYLHAAACRHSGRDLPAVENVSNGPIVVDGQSIQPPSAEELQTWLIRQTGQTKTFSPDSQTDYPMFGAGTDRNGASAGQLPMTNKRWDLVTTASPRQERDVRETADALVASGKLPPPSWVPLRVGNHLLMRTTERLVGVDYRTGKRVWTYPWQTTSAELNNDDQSLDSLENEKAIAELLKQRVWNDNPYGQLTSDGTRVFMLDSLQKVDLIPFSSLAMRGTRPADGRSNTLVALDLNTEGKLLWRLGAGVDKPSDLSDAFFLGPPLPLDGRLYVIAELAGDISLFCLDPADGSEIWRQQLVAVESGGIETDAIRRIAGAVPTYRDGVLICPTGAGAIVAVDVADRMIRWGLSYNRIIGLNRTMIARGRGTDSSQLMQRWYSSAAVISDTTVLVTPIESDRLYVLDLLTGDRPFPKLSRMNMRYLAGARDDLFFVVGTSQMRAFDKRTGKLAWSSSSDLLDAGQVISGVGAFGDGEYLLPTSTNEIIRVSLKDGSVLGRRTTRYTLGNLVAAKGEIISQSPTKLSVAFGEQSLGPIVNRMLEIDPNDSEALVRKAELLIERGDRSQALTLLDRASKEDQENVEIRMLSVVALLGQLRENPRLGKDLVEKLDALIERPDQRIEYLSLLTRSALEQQDYAVAVQRLFELSALLQSNPMLEPTVMETSDQSGRTSTLDVWIAARLVEVANQADEADRAAINDHLAEIANAKRSEPTSALEPFIRQFGLWDGTDVVRQELEQRLRKNGELLKLERLALGTQPPTDPVLQQLAPDRLLSLASAYSAGDQPLDAIHVLKQLEPLEDTEDQARVEQIRDRSSTEIQTHTWPESASVIWEPRRAPMHNLIFNQRISETKVQAGRQFEDWTLVSDRSSPIALRDPTGFVRTVRGEGFRPQDSSDKQAQICGGFMAVMTTSGMTGVDLFRLKSNNGDAALWRWSFGSQVGPMARRQSQTNPFGDKVYQYHINSPGAVQDPPELKLGPILGDRLIFLRGGELLAIDILTSTTLWRNADAPKSGSILCDGQRVAVVSPKSKRIDFFNLMDGRKLESKPWEHEKIWAATDTHVLAYQARPEQTTVRLVNPFTGNVELEHQTVGANRTLKDIPCAYGRVIGGAYMTLMASNGDAIVWDLRQATEIANTQLSEYPDLIGLNVVRLKDQLVFLPERRQLRNKQLLTRATTTKVGQNHQTTHGAHSISLIDGHVLWQRQFDKPWGCTIYQPADTPLMMLARSTLTKTPTSRRRSIEALALDVRTGEDLHPAQTKQITDSVNALETQLTVDAANAQVVVHIGPEVLTYTFRDDTAESQE